MWTVKEIEESMTQEFALSQMVGLLTQTELRRFGKE